MEKKPVKKKKKNLKRKLISTVRKDASIFLSSEEGKIIKKDIVKMAIAMGLTAASLGTAEAQYSDMPHQDVARFHSDNLMSTLHNDGNNNYHSSGHADATNSHSDVAHLDHSDHSSHSSGGWC